MRRKLQECVPPWISPFHVCKSFAAGLGAAAVYSLLRFLLAYFQVYSQLWERDWRTGNMVLRQDAQMTPFGELLFPALLGFAVAAAVMLCLAAFYYGSFSRGSHSLYLMRRLPDRWELARRCLCLPFAGFLLAAAAAALFSLAFFALYRLVTPPQCLPFY